MRITSILIIRSLPSDENPIILANECDVSHSSYFESSSFREFIGNVAKQTLPEERRSFQNGEYKVHAYNGGGIYAVGFMDDHYPVQSAFSLLIQVLDEFKKNYDETWKTLSADTQPWPYLNEMLTKYQDSAEADKLLKIHRELDETKIILGVQSQAQLPGVVQNSTSAGSGVASDQGRIAGQAVAPALQTQTTQASVSSVSTQDINQQTNSAMQPLVAQAAMPTPKQWYQQPQEQHKQYQQQYEQYYQQYRVPQQHVPVTQYQAHPQMQHFYPLPYPQSQTQHHPHAQSQAQPHSHQALAYPPSQVDQPMNPRAPFQAQDAFSGYQSYPQPQLHPQAHQMPTGAQQQHRYHGQMQGQLPPQASHVRPYAALPNQQQPAHGQAPSGPSAQHLPVYSHTQQPGYPFQAHQMPTGAQHPGYPFQAHQMPTGAQHPGYPFQAHQMPTGAQQPRYHGQTQGQFPRQASHVRPYAAVPNQQQPAHGQAPSGPSAQHLPVYSPTQQPGYPFQQRPGVQALQQAPQQQYMQQQGTFVQSQIHPQGPPQIQTQLPQQHQQNYAPSHGVQPNNAESPGGRQMVPQSAGSQPYAQARSAGPGHVRFTQSQTYPIRTNSQLCAYSEQHAFNAQDSSKTTKCDMLNAQTVEGIQNQNHNEEAIGVVGKSVAETQVDKNVKSENGIEDAANGNETKRDLSLSSASELPGPKQVFATQSKPVEPDVPDVQPSMQAYGHAQTQPQPQQQGQQQTIDSVLSRGERLDSLVEKSSSPDSQIYISDVKIYSSDNSTTTGILRVVGGNLEYQKSEEQTVVVPFSTIRECFYENVENSVRMYIHFRLWDDLRIGSKWTKDVQFYHEVGCGPLLKRLAKENQMMRKIKEFVEGLALYWGTHYRDLKLRFALFAEDRKLRSLESRRKNIFYSVNDECITQLKFPPFTLLRRAEIEEIEIRKGGYKNTATIYVKLSGDETKVVLKNLVYEPKAWATRVLDTFEYEAMGTKSMELLGKIKDVALSSVDENLHENLVLQNSEDTKRKRIGEMKDLKVQIRGKRAARGRGGATRNKE